MLRAYGLLFIALTLAVTAFGRDITASGDGGTNPPWPGPAQPTASPASPNGPTLNTNIGPTIVRLVPLTHSPFREFRRIVVRQGDVILDTGMAPVGEPFVLRIPDAPGITLDVIGFGSDAFGVPVQVGQRVLVVLP